MIMHCSSLSVQTTFFTLSLTYRSSLPQNRGQVQFGQVHLFRGHSVLLFILFGKSSACLSASVARCTISIIFVQSFVQSFQPWYDVRSITAKVFKMHDHFNHMQNQSHSQSILSDIWVCCQYFLVIRDPDFL